MKLHEIKGDLLKFPEGIQVIAHQANVQERMRSGIAKQISEQIPEMVVADKEFPIPVGPMRLGHCSHVHLLRENFKKIYMGFNLYGQQLGVNSQYGCPTDYDALFGALNSMKNHLAMQVSGSIFNIVERPVKIGFPKLMGCALGGGQWSIVKELIQIAFYHYDVEIYIVEFGEE